jgi:nucleoside-diphosphate-sugar epimerase
VRELVLGGDGLIGSALVEALRARGDDVDVLDQKRGSDLRTVGLDPFAAADRVWFLAWATGGARYLEARERQHEILRSNCELASRVFDALARTGKPFVFTTSQLAGRPDAYGMTKLLGEHWARELGGKVARLWNVYGWEEPSERSHLVPDLVFSGLDTGVVACATTGAERRRLLYKTDCVAALLELADRPAGAADVAGPAWLTVREVAETVAARLGVDARFGEAAGSEVMVEPDLSTLPGWRPRVPLEEGIDAVIADARRFLDRRGGGGAQAILASALA